MRLASVMRTPRLRTGRAVAAASACVLGLTVLGLAVPAAQATRIVPWKAVEVLSPAGGGFGQLNAIACPKAGACEAAGSYYVTTLRGDGAMVAAEGRHGWSRAVRIRLPSNAEGEDQNTMLPSIACPSVKSCVAVGYYTWGTGFMDGLMTTGHGTSWSKSRTPVLPKGVAVTDGAGFSGVSCPKVGYCEAVGGSGLSTSLPGQAMVEAMTRGRWQRAVTVRAPAGAYIRPTAYLSSVSCTAVGDCVAVGHFVDKATAYVPMAAVETRGKWGRAVQVDLPRGGLTGELNSVSCVRTGCEAAGTYTTRSGSTAFVVNEARGRWRYSLQITSLPAGALKSAPTVDLFGISCLPYGCLAVGGYENRVGALVPMTVLGSGRTWVQAKSVGLPHGGALSESQPAQLWAVSCDAADLYCTAAGNYSPAGGTSEAMAASGGM
jgi:hypothetical protein